MLIRAASVVLAGALALSGAVPAAIATETDPSLEEQDAPSPGIVVSADARVLESSADNFEFSLGIENPLTTEVEAGEVTLELVGGPVADRDELRERLADPALTGDEPPAASDDGVDEHFFAQDVAGVGAESNRDETLEVPSTAFPLRASDPAGVYLVCAEHTFPSADGAETTTHTVTPIVWRSVTGTPVQVASIVPLVLPSEIDTVPTPAQLDSLAPRFSALLDQAEAQSSQLAIDPRLIAAIRAYGAAAPASATTLLERLETTGLSSFLLQFADADPAAQAAIGISKLMEPESLGYVTQQGEFPAADDSGAAETGAAATDAPQPDATQEDGIQEDATDGDRAREEAAEPDLDELLAWPQQQQPTAWPSENRVDSATLALLDDSNIDRVVVTSDNAALRGGPNATLAGSAALVTDAHLGESVAAALKAETDVERQAALAEAAAELALAASDPRDNELLLGLDRSAMAEAEAPEAVMEALSELDWVRTRPVEGLSEGTARLQKVSPVAKSQRKALQAAIDRVPNVTAFGAVLRDPEFLHSYQHDRLLELFATRHQVAGGDFEAAAEAYADRDAELLEGVTTVSTEHIQLVGTSTNLPVQLKNALPFEAIVTVHASPASAAVAVPEREFRDIAVPEAGHQAVMIPVNTRVSSGESTLSVTVTDASGDFVSSESSLPLTIHSNLEQIALWILGTLAALLLVFGIIRSLRRRRAQRE